MDIILKLAFNHFPGNGEEKRSSRGWNEVLGSPVAYGTDSMAWVRLVLTVHGKCLKQPQRNLIWKVIKYYKGWFTIQDLENSARDGSSCCYRAVSKPSPSWKCMQKYSSKICTAIPRKRHPVVFNSTIQSYHNQQHSLSGTTGDSCTNANVAAVAVPASYVVALALVSFSTSAAMSSNLAWTS